MATVKVEEGQQQQEMLDASEQSEESMEVEDVTSSGKRTKSGGGPPRKKKKTPKSNEPKNALMQLNELKPGLTYEVESQQGPSHEPVFMVSVTVNGQKFYGKGGSKQLAKHAAAESALKSFVQFRDMPEVIASFMKPPTSFADFTADNIENQVPDYSSFEKTIKSENGSPPVQDGSMQARTKLAKKLSKIINEADQHNPIMLLNELQPGLTYQFVRENPFAPSQRFVMSVNINGETYEGVGPNKKAARASAARSALSKRFNVNFHMLSFPAGSDMNREIFSFPQNIADKIAKAVNDTFNNIMANNVDFAKWKVLAGIVMTSDETMEEVRVIGIGTGTKHLNGEYMSMCGTALNDCHAEVISRRCLRDFLYSQLELHAQGNGNDSVLEKGPSGKFVLRPNLKFHLFISTSPCGDARIFSVHQDEYTDVVDLHPNRKARGLLRTKIESGEGTIPVKEGQGIQTWDGIIQGQQRYLTMSCSDKVLSWNILGVQGSLLSHFLEPVYIHSIVLGRLFHSEHMYRAMCGRIKDHLKDLPPPYSFNLPKMCVTTSLEVRQLAKSPNFSVSWTTGMEKPEIVTARIGKQDSGHISRLCKLSLFQRFTNLYKCLGPKDLPLPTTLLYADMKNAVPEYRNAKEAICKAFKEANLGQWVKKPMEQDQFEVGL